MADGNGDDTTTTSDEIIATLRELADENPALGEDLERKILLLNRLDEVDIFKLAATTVAAIEKWSEFLLRPELTKEEAMHASSSLIFLSTLLARKVFLEHEPTLIEVPN